MTGFSVRVLRFSVLVGVLHLCGFAAETHRIVNTYKLGGEGGWDYLTVDAAARRLYISRATHVVVVDADSGKTVGDIPDTPGVHGIALAPELARGFISNGREGTVTVFGPQTLKTISKIKVGENPDAIVYDAASKRVFTMNGHSHDATAIDAATNAVIGTIKLDGKPEFVVSDDAGTLFVNIEDKSELQVLDPKRLAVKATWPLAPCESPSGLAIDLKHRRLFSVCENKLMVVVDADSGKVLTSLPIGGGVDGAVFDAETGLAFASCGEGILTVVREEAPNRFNVVENVTIERGARTLALDPKTHHVFLVTAKFGPPPAATAEQPHPRPTVMPDSFEVLEIGN